MWVMGSPREEKGVDHLKYRALYCKSPCVEKGKTLLPGIALKVCFGLKLGYDNIDSQLMK